MWMLLVLFYGIIKGIREVCKKKALSKNTLMEVLFVYTLISFFIAAAYSACSYIFKLPGETGSLLLSGKQMLWVGIKSFIIFVAWIVGFKAIDKLPISIYGVLDLSRVIFSTLLGIIVLHEVMTPIHLAGLIAVCSGLLLLKFKPPFVKRAEMKMMLENGDVSEVVKKPANADSKAVGFYVFLAFLSCVLNACSGLLDKILMGGMTSNQLQFWYMGFLTLYYGLYMIVTRTKITKSVWRNEWVWLLAILLMIMDKALFIANGMADSQITVMTLIKQSGAIVTILAGKFVFKEKGIGYKMFCAAVIILGIVLGVM